MADEGQTLETSRDDDSQTRGDLAVHHYYL